MSKLVGSPDLPLLICRLMVPNDQPCTITSFVLRREEHVFGPIPLAHLNEVLPGTRMIISPAVEIQVSTAEDFDFMTVLGETREHRSVLFTLKKAP